MALAALVATVAVIATIATSAFAATAVGLGTAGSYTVLGGQTVTNTGPSDLPANLGVYPGTAISGFPPGGFGGALHQTDAHARQAQIDLVTAYDRAAAQAPEFTVSTDLGGQTLTQGVYFSASSASLTGELTLDGAGDSNSVWVFQVGSALTTAPDSAITLTNGASACNVFWQVGSSATLGVDSSFVGTIMALTSITANTRATVEGRALARNGSVTLDDNDFDVPSCAAVPTPAPTGTATPAPAPTGNPTPGVPEPSVSPSPSGSPSPGGSASPTASPGAPGVPTDGPSTPGTGIGNGPDDSAPETDEGRAERARNAHLADTGGASAPMALGAAFVLFIGGGSLAAAAAVRRRTRRAPGTSGN